MPCLYSKSMFQSLDYEVDVSSKDKSIYLYYKRAKELEISYHPKNYTHLYENP